MQTVLLASYYEYLPTRYLKSEDWPEESNNILGVAARCSNVTAARKHRRRSFVKNAPPLDWRALGDVNFLRGMFSSAC